MKSDFRQHHDRRNDESSNEVRPDLWIRLASFLSIPLLLISSVGCDSESSEGYHVVQPAETQQKKTPDQETGSSTETPPPEKQTADPQQKPEETPEETSNSETKSGIETKPGTEAEPGKTPDGETETKAEETPGGVAALRMQSPSVPNPLAGGDDGPVRLLVPNKTFSKNKDALIVSYDDLDLIKVLNLKVPEANVMDLLPDWLKKLNGQKVQIRGFMYPAFQEEGLDRFVFCRDTGACCFGPNPVIYYLIDVRMQKGATTNYIQNRPFDVTGTLRIKPGIIPETGQVYELYHLEDATVRER